MTNDMIALASDWEDRLRPPKCDKKEDPQVWATSFPHMLSLTQKEKKFKPEGNDYLKKTHHNWTKTHDLQRPCFKQDTKTNQRWLKAM